MRFATNALVSACRLGRSLGAKRSGPLEHPPCRCSRVKGLAPGRCSRTTGLPRKQATPWSCTCACNTRMQRWGHRSRRLSLLVRSEHSRPSGTSERQLVSPGNRPITFVRRRSPTRPQSGDGKLRLQVVISELEHAGYDAAARCLLESRRNGPRRPGRRFAAGGCRKQVVGGSDIRTALPVDARAALDVLACASDRAPVGF